MLGGQSLWGPDNLLTAVIMVLGCSFFRTNGECSHNAEKPDRVPLRIHKIHYCQLQSLKERTRPPKVMQILEKIGKGRQEGKKFSGQRERRRGAGDISSALSIPSIEGERGPNSQVFEGSVAIGTSDQSGYWEPMRIIRSLKTLYLATGMWQNCTWKTKENVTKQHSFSLKQELLQQFFLALFPLPSCFEPL